MMKQRKPLSAVLVVALVLTLLTGCGRPQEGKIFRYDLSGDVTNLDPQYTGDPAAKIILHNLFEGLVHQSPDGAILPAVAERWEVSPDGQTYTFYLRSDRLWAVPSGSEDEPEPVTAADFLFAFQRIYEKGSVSPQKEIFRAIQNSGETVTGVIGIQNLGVKAPDDNTLVFSLSYPDSQFLEKLATQGAFPCNKEFFEITKGRYGLGPKLLLGNGPFRLTQWEEKEYIGLRKNNNYPDPVLPQGINFFLGRTNREELFLDGKADILRINAGYREEELLDKATDIIRSPETTWALVFNAEDAVWSAPLLRQSLAYTTDYQSLESVLSDHFKPTHELLPPATKLGNLDREHYGKESPLGYDEVKGRELYGKALQNMGLTRVPTTVLYVPEEGDHERYMKVLQQGWQQSLSLYLQIEPLPAEEMRTRLQSGDYQIMLLPLTAGDSSPDSLLQTFESGNAYGYSSQVFDSFLDSARQSSTPEEQGQFYRYAQGTLLDDAEVIPLYYENVTYVVGNKSEGFEFHPFGDLIYFINALKS